ncbi:MAG: YdcF family protein, partial [Pseudoalteromonas nigrifaciens]
PNAQALHVVTQYSHEVVGKAWISMRRWIDPEAL